MHKCTSTYHLINASQGFRPKAAEFHLRILLSSGSAQIQHLKSNLTSNDVMAISVCQDSSQWHAGSHACKCYSSAPLLQANIHPFWNTQYACIGISRSIEPQGFHEFHVVVATIFLTVCLFRLLSHHFTKKHHFGFEAAAWYWHIMGQSRTSCCL